MTLPADRWPLGLPHAIGAVIVRALREHVSLAGAKVLDNPSRASDLNEGERIIFFEDQFDRPRESVQKRSYEFSIGAISRKKDARSTAHADYRATKRVLRQICMPELTQSGLQLDARGLTEGEVRFRLENIDVGGGLVLGLFAIDYRDPLLI